MYKVLPAGLEALVEQPVYDGDRAPIASLAPSASSYACVIAATSAARITTVT